MKKFFASAIACITMASMLGCPAQSTISTLITTLGQASAQIATLEGNSSLALKLQTDTAAASSAVLNWKKGSPATVAIEAMNLVMADLNLVPVAGPYAPLIDIALVTAEGIIAELNPGAVTPATARRFSMAAKNKKDFVKKWNAACANDPKLAPALLK